MVMLHRDMPKDVADYLMLEDNTMGNYVHILFFLQIFLIICFLPIHYPNICLC